MKENYLAKPEGAWHMHSLGTTSSLSLGNKMPMLMWMRPNRSNQNRCQKIPTRITMRLKSLSYMKKLKSLAKQSW